MISHTSRLAFLCGLALLLGCDLEVIPDNFTGTGGGPDEGAPRACFSASATNCEAGDCNLSFDASCSERAVTYRWDFDNDGIFELDGSDIAPGFAYDAPGDFTVRLEVEDAQNRTDDTTLTVSVAAPSLVTFEVTDPTVKGASGLVPMDDGGILLAGHEDNDIYLRRIGADGEVLLNRTYAAPAAVTVRDLTALADGTFVVIGTYFDDAAGDIRTIYLRVTSNGTAINGPVPLPIPDGQAMFRVVELNDGSLVFVGTEQRQFTPGRDLRLVRLSANLTTLFWSRTLVGAGEAFLSVGEVLARDDGFIVVGSEFSILQGSEGFFARYDTGGNLATGHPRPTSQASDIVFNAITEAGDDYLVAGTISPGVSNIILVRTDADGVTLAGYPKILDEPNDQLVSDIRSTTDGGAIIAGQDNQNAMLLRIDGNSVPLWQRAENLTGQSLFTQTIPAPDGGFYGCGFRGESLYYVKTDAEGMIE